MVASNRAVQANKKAGVCMRRLALGRDKVQNQIYLSFLIGSQADVKQRFLRVFLPNASK